MRAIPIAALATSILIASPALAQQDRAAGLFTEARQLPLVSQSLNATIAAGEVELTLVQVFSNDGDAVGQADYHLFLPQGASVTAFGFWQGDRFLKAELKEKGEAKAAHHKAAAEGRATALMKKEDNIHTFSVYPVAAGELKQVETTLRLPLQMEMGKTRLPLPIDAFLGQAPVTSTVLVEIRSDEPLAGVGVDGASFRELYRNEHQAQLVFAARRPVEVWYFEEVPPLLTRADAVRLDDGQLGVQVRIALYDAGEWRAPYSELHLLVDGSFSMRRRAASLRQLIGRVIDQAPTPVNIYTVAEEVVAVSDGLPPRDTVAEILNGSAGHGSSWALFQRTLEELNCGRSDVRCAVISDPQLGGLFAELAPPASVVLLSDPHELAHFADRLPSTALTHQTDIDGDARLLGIGDELVLPVLDVGALMQGDRPVELVGQQSTRVPEGGMLRLVALTDTLAPIQLNGSLAGNSVERSLTPALLDSATASGAGVRRGVYRELLASWMQSYRNAPDPSLKERIVSVSLREEIPTAFTALQVDDPKLSLFAIKPGDPLLTVHHQPGLEEVIAWYPFGETRRLVFDDDARTFTDRFLVPRGWRESLYRVEIFKVFAEGWIERAHAWYQLDEQGPTAQLLYDPGEGILRVETGDETRLIGSVTIHVAAGEVLELTPVDGAWMILADELPEEFTIYVRDRAGNRTELRCRLKDGELTVRPPKRTERHAPELAAADVTLTAVGDGIEVDGGWAHLNVDGRDLRFPTAGLSLRSLRLSGHLVEADTILLGTAGGDLLRLRCSGATCTAKALGTGLEHHPVTGFARLSKQTVLVGVLGQGLRELRGDRLQRSELRVGSRFVTAVLAHDSQIFVGTAYNGLWRVVRRRAIKTRFEHPHVGALRLGADGLEVDSGFGHYVRRERDRFDRLSLSLADVATGSPDLTAAARWDDVQLIAGFDSGLFRLDGERLLPVELGLTPAQSRINAMLTHDGAVWLGTEAGLLVVDRDDCGVGVHTLLEGAVHDLAVTPRGIAVASSEGLYVVDADSRVSRVDFQRGVGSGSFMAVAWHSGRLFAGGMEGLYWFTDHTAGQVTDGEGFDAGWVTALLADGDRLLVGTYDQGVYRFGDGRATQVAALQHQWVPPHALRRVGDAVWVGGIGMAPVRLSDDGTVTAAAAPVRDVNDFVALPTGLLMLTSDGLVRASDPRSVATAGGR